MKGQGRRGVTVWLTGLPCSGKSTLAGLLATWLRKKGYRTEVLDGDVVRQHLSQGLGFSKEDRDTNIRRIGFVCSLLSRNGIVAIAAAISPYRAIRDEVRQMVGCDFLEVAVRCSVGICAQRDVKGMYRKAQAGELKGFTGVDDPYEPPLSPEVLVETDREAPEESLAKLIQALMRRGYLEDG